MTLRSRLQLIINAEFLEDDTKTKKRFRSIRKMFARRNNPIISQHLNGFKGCVSMMNEHESVLNSVVQDIREIAAANSTFFERSKLPFSEQLCILFGKLVVHTHAITPFVERIQNGMKAYDYEQINANGYRSLVRYYTRAAVKTNIMLHNIHSKRDSVSLSLNTAYFFKEVEAWVTLLECMQLLMSVCVEFMKLSHSQLFTDMNDLSEELQKKIWEVMTSPAAYGRTLGFQFCESLGVPFTVVMTTLASYSESYSYWKTPPFQTASTLLFSPKFAFNPELRSAKVSQIFHRASPDFCKSFYNLSETTLINFSTNILLPDVALNKTFILPVEPIELETRNSTSREYPTITVKPSEASFMNRIQVRLLSNHPQHRAPRFFYFNTEASVDVYENDNFSNTLLFHVHGGGFISMSSKSHEVYLRTWTRELQVPILSVDYSLAPEHPFPNGLDDCLYAYVWALKNADILGWNGKYVVFIGDSAGGNLVVALTLKLLSMSIRTPDLIICFYPSLNLQMRMSPSRLLSFADVLLNGEMLIRFGAAYAGIKPVSSEVPSSKQKKYFKRAVEWTNTNDLFEAMKNTELLRNPFFSPFCASDELLKRLPKTYITACHNDPLLDDSIEFAKRLKKLGVPHELNLVNEGVSHGFLNMLMTSKDCKHVFDECTKKIQKILIGLEQNGNEVNL